MKRTYINPEIIVVSLMPTTAMLIVFSNPSVSINLDPNASVDAGSVDTKGISDINIWDEEW